MSTGNGTGWTVSMEMLDLLPQGTGSKRSPSCQMPQTWLNVEPPTTWSVVSLHLGLGFSVRVVLNLSYRQSDLELLL